MYRRAKLRTWGEIQRNHLVITNEKGTYHKVSYSPAHEAVGLMIKEDYSGVRDFYTSYFGKEVWVLRKIFSIHEYDVFTDKGSWLMKAHASWFTSMSNESVERPFKERKKKEDSVPVTPVAEPPPPVVSLSHLTLDELFSF